MRICMCASFQRPQERYVQVPKTTYGCDLHDGVRRGVVDDGADGDLEMGSRARHMKVLPKGEPPTVG